MARPLRIEYPGALYHVIVRGNERKSVFRDDTDRTDYLNRLAHYREKLGFEVLAYCLMGNHVHLAIETGKTPLSRIMAALQSSYTQSFNRRHARVGHLFQGRYKALLVEKDRYALALVRYIHENPVKAGFVKRAERYRWSSDRDYRRGKGPPWLAIDRVLSMLGPRPSVSLLAYRRLMREEMEESYEAVPSWRQAVKGDEAFADRVLQEAGEAPVVRQGLTVESIAQEIGRREGISPIEMRSKGRGRRPAQARFLVAWLGREGAGISISRTATYFERDASTIAKGVTRLEEAMRENRRLRSRADHLRRSLA